MKLSGGEKDKMKCEISEGTKSSLKLVIESIARIIEKDKPIKNKTLIEICRSNKIKLVSSETDRFTTTANGARNFKRNAARLRNLSNFWNCAY